MNIRRTFNEFKCMKCGETNFVSLIYVPDYPVCDVCITNWVGDKL